MQVPSKLYWRRGKDTKFETGYYVQSVKIEGKVYVGQGRSEKKSVIMEYDICSEEWTELAPYTATDFAVTTINNKLVLVGGRNRESSERIKELGVWEEERWQNPYPEMKKECSSCSAIAYRQWLVVAGGLPGGGGEMLTSVEVMNIETKQWYAGPSTPIGWHSMKTALVGDNCFFMGGYTGENPTSTVYRISLLQWEASEERQVWTEIHSTMIWSAPLSIGGALLAVGGRNAEGGSDTVMPAIHLYQPDTGEWVKVGDLPTPRYACTCAMIGDRELLVAGGSTRPMELTSKVDLALIA